MTAPSIKAQANPSFSDMPHFFLSVSTLPQAWLCPGDDQTNILRQREIKALKRHY